MVMGAVCHFVTICALNTNCILLLMSIKLLNYKTRHLPQNICFNRKLEFTLMADTRHVPKLKRLDNDSTNDRGGQAYYGVKLATV